jgi:hypothetical protein
MLFHHLAVVYFLYSWKRIHTERQAGFWTPATAITFNNCWLQNLFLDFEVCQNWKISNYTFEFWRGVRESSLSMHGSGLRYFKQPQSLQTPTVSRFPETEVYIRVLAGSRNYYIKDLRKIRKRIPFIIRRFQPPYATTLTLWFSHVLPLTLARDVTSLAP